MKIDHHKVLKLLAWPKATPRDTPLYQFIYNDLKTGILNGELPNGCELPPSRSLAEGMGLSRSTIVNVYDLLKLEGLIEATMGSGYRISTPRSNMAVKPQKRNEKHNYAALSEVARSFYSNVGLINAIDDPGIAFRPGIPPLDLFPIIKWKKLSDEYWKFVKASELSYYAGAGVEVLRKTIANYLNLRRNTKCAHDQVFVVSGSLQSLYLIGNLLLNPGDEVLAENPTFPNAHSVFKSLRGQVTGISLRDDGLDVNELSAKAGKSAKLLHVTPSCQYPMGMQMSHARKAALLEVAHEKGLYIVENDYENEVNHPKRDGETIFSMDQEDRCFYLGTFNRILHPSIRIGFVVVPRHLVNVFQAIVIHTHRFVSPNSQVVLRSFIEKKFLHEHMKQVTYEAARRHQHFTKVLREKLGSQLEIVPFDCPSLHVTALLKNGRSDVEVVSALAKKGIVAHALSKCYVAPPKRQGLIFGYASVQPQYAARMIERMAEIMLQE